MVTVLVLIEFATAKVVHGDVSVIIGITIEANVFLNFGVYFFQITLKRLDSTISKIHGKKIQSLKLAEISRGGPSQLMSIKVKCHPIFSRI